MVASHLFKTVVLVEVLEINSIQFLVGNWQWGTSISFFVMLLHVCGCFPCMYVCALHAY